MRGVRKKCVLHVPHDRVAGIMAKRLLDNLFECARASLGCVLWVLQQCDARFTSVGGMREDAVAKTTTKVPEVRNERAHTRTNWVRAE